MKMLHQLAGISALALLCAAPAGALDLNGTTVPGRKPGDAGWPTPLSDREIAINRADRRLIYKNVDGTLGYGALLNATNAARKAVEQSDASDLGVQPSLGASPGTLSWIISWLSGVDTVAGVRSSVHGLFSSVQTLGYYARGDGGAARYLYDATDTTSVDNGCSVLVGLDGARWKLDRVRDLDLRQCGAKGNGTDDDTIAIRATFSTPKAVITDVRGGVYPVSGDLDSIVMGDRSSFRGSGRDVSVFKAISTNKRIFWLGGYRQSMRHFGVVAGAAQVEGSTFVHLAGTEPVVDDFAVAGHHNGVWASGVGYYLGHGRMLGLRPGGIGVRAEGGDTSSVIDGILMGAEEGSPNVGRAGFRLRNAIALRIVNCDVLQQGIAMLIDPYTSTSAADVLDAGPVLSVIVANTHLDSSGTFANLAITPTGTGGVGRIRFVESWTGSGAGDSIVIAPTDQARVSNIEFDGHHSAANDNGAGVTTGGNGNIEDIVFNGGMFAQNKFAGFFNTGRGIRINAMRIGPTSIMPANSSAGFVFDANVGRFSVLGSDFTDQPNALIDQTASTNTKIIKNNFGVADQ